MKILFLDQSGQLGGAELCLLDIVQQLSCQHFPTVEVEVKVALLSPGPFQAQLAQANINHVLLRKHTPHPEARAFFSRRLREFLSLSQCLKDLISLSRESDLIYANTSKAMVLGTIAHLITGRPLVYHLHDILSPQHFLWLNRNLLVLMANCCASHIIANSQVTQQAFAAAGGEITKSNVIYNGFLPEKFHIKTVRKVSSNLPIGAQVKNKSFVLGCFSRLSPWKGQHILVEALASLNEPNIKLFLVGNALFGEEEYALQLRQQVKSLGLTEQVQFLGFRQDIPELLAQCDLMVHAPVAPEPFGRVIVEAMLAGKAMIAPREGSGPELLEHGQTGWLVTPRSSTALALAIQELKARPNLRLRMGQAAAKIAQQRFHLNQTNHSILRLLHQVLDQDFKLDSPVTVGRP